MTSITQEAWQEQGDRIKFRALFMYAYDYDQTGFRNIKDSSKVLSLNSRT